MTDLHVIAGRN